MAGLAVAMLLPCLVATPLHAEDSRTACDRLAADPADQDKPFGVAGVSIIDFSVANTAVQQCTIAVGMEASNSRYLFQLARAIESRDREYLGNALAAYERAVAAGNGTAMAQLDLIYMSSDFVIARGWLEKAARHRSPKAMRSLGDIYLHGLGVDIDLAAARSRFEKALEAGDTGSATILANWPH